MLQMINGGRLALNSLKDMFEDRRATQYVQGRVDPNCRLSISFDKEENSEVCSRS